MRTIRSYFAGVLVCILTACASAPTACPEIVAETASVALDWEAEAGHWEARARQERDRRREAESTAEALANDAWWTGFQWGSLIVGGSVLILGGLVLFNQSVQIVK